MSATRIKNFALSGTAPQLTPGATLPSAAPWISASVPVVDASGSVKSIVPADLTADGGRVGPGFFISRPDVEHAVTMSAASRPSARNAKRPNAERRRTDTG